MRFAPALTLLIFLSAAPAMAEPYTYAPERCEFEITFPEKPYITNKCTGTEVRECLEVVSFTKVITIDTSVNFRVTCAIDQKERMASLDENKMKEAVSTLLQEANLQESDPEYSDEDGIKSAAVVSLGERGDREVFYTAQLWAGQTSILTLEADMTGKADEKADKLFTSILKSMKPKHSVKPKAPGKKAE